VLADVSQPVVITSADRTVALEGIGGVGKRSRRGRSPGPVRLLADVGQWPRGTVAAHYPE